MVVGTVRDVEKHFNKEMKRISLATSNFGDVRFHFVESDSSDRTLEILQENANLNSKFTYTTLGFLETEFPNRIERIRFARNSYVQTVRQILQEGHILDYVLVLDMDGMNPKISIESLESNFQLEVNWDACFANQRHGYYDLYALNCDGWVDTDIFKEIELKLASIRKHLGKPGPVKEFLFQNRVRNEVIYKNMRILRKNDNPILVNSAFGGAGLYKAHLFKIADYSVHRDHRELICEHKDFHQALTSTGAKLYINPRFINSHWNTYNINRIFLIRLIRHLRRLYFNQFRT